MKIASYNLENLFLRPVAMNGKTLAEGKDALKAHADLNTVLAKVTYSAADKKRIVELLKKLKLEKSDDGGPFALLRQNKGDLIKRPKNKPIEVVADGRGDWIGWVELKREEVDEVATRNTARVINELNADILGIVEAESRPALTRFSQNVIGLALGGTPYAHAMLIDGNDDRGIDVAVYTRDGFDIASICSHVDDTDSKGRVFSRDCAQYEIKTPNGKFVHVLVNHFKSKGYGNAADSDERRRRQAVRVKEIYNALRQKHDNVVVLGDLNDTPTSAPLKPMMAETDMKDVSEHPNFVSDGRPGTYKNGTAGNKIDYVLLSPALFNKVSSGGILRKGVWGGTNGTLFPHYPEITKESEAASDHAAIWADIAI
ncbi:MAG TPA: endonuclease/exonuclease/phosphatase family protein [Reyranellaceae bacterium]|nr:endonuclease/exonuclease/phosphatase family protein [Reyranellaceae bacterium]